MITYTYNARVIRWVDGDTVDLFVDLGFSTWAKQRFRLADIDTPERGQPNYIEARERAKQMAPEDSMVLVKSFKTDKYGRYLGVIMADMINVNQQLLLEGVARAYKE